MSAPFNKPDDSLDRGNQTGFFNISQVAHSRIEAKRKRKGLGELQKRQNPVHSQFFQSGSTMLVVNAVCAPIERLRIIQQTVPLNGAKTPIPSMNLSLASKIASEQGLSAFWRGNMPKIYLNTSQMILRVLLFDRIKQSTMPYDEHKYQGFDWFWRVAVSASICQALTLFVTYPLDLIHTRTSADMTIKG